MSQKFVSINATLQNFKAEIIKHAKRAIKKNVPKTDLIRKDIRDNLVVNFNNYTHCLATSWNAIEAEQKVSARQEFLIIRDKVIRAFQILDVKYKVPILCIEAIDPNILDEVNDSDTDDFEMALSTVEFLNLAHKIVPNSFDGSHEKLQGFLDALFLLKSVAGDNENAVAFVKTRLQDKARDIITYESSLDQVINTLKNNIKGDDSRFVVAKLQNLKQNSKSPTAFVTEIEALAIKLKRAYIQEGVPPQVAEKYSTDAVVKAFVTNANSERQRIVMEAGCFNSVQEAVTKFVNISGQQDQSNVLHLRHNTDAYNQGRGHFMPNRGNYYPSRGRAYRSRFQRGNRSRGGPITRYIRNFNTNQDQGNQFNPQVELGDA